MTMSTKLLHQANANSRSTKITVSHAEISDSYLDPTQPPTRRVPFKHLRELTFIKSLKICLPTRTYNHLYRIPADKASSPSADRKHPQLKFSKVIVSFNEILHDHGLRTGSFIMLAQPFPSSPISPSLPSSNATTMSLNNGTLTVEMPYSISQRAGLGAAFKGTEVGSGGRKHQKQSLRYRFVINLREPNMVRGRPAFDRLLWAAKEVDGLKEPRIWLVAESENHSLKAMKKEEAKNSKKRKREVDEQDELLGTGDDTTDLLKTQQPITNMSQTKLDATEHKSHTEYLIKHHSTTIEASISKSEFNTILIPEAISNPTFFNNLHSRTAENNKKGNLLTILEEDIHDVIEYLDLLFLRSPRITRADYRIIDPYICRYTLPDTSLATTLQQSTTDPEESYSNEKALNETDLPKDVRIDDLTILEHSGFISSDFASQFVIDLIRRSRAVEISASTAPAQSGSGLGSGSDCDWAVVQIQTHPTEVLGGTDGLTILLQSEPLRDTISSEKQIAEADTMAANHMDLDEDEEFEGRGISKAFRHVTCFKFVDSIVQ